MHNLFQSHHRKYLTTQPQIHLVINNAPKQTPAKSKVPAVATKKAIRVPSESYGW